MVEIRQTIEKLDDGLYDVHMEIGDVVYTEQYNRSNAVFPAFRELTQSLYEFEDCDVSVVTNSAPLAREFNSAPNPNATLLNNLREAAVRQGVTLTIIHDDN